MRQIIGRDGNRTDLIWLALLADNGRIHEWVADSQVLKRRL